MFSTFTRRAALSALALGLATTVAAAQDVGPPARSSTEMGNFGDLPFANPQIVITRAEDRAAWRKLEDQQLKERRDLEDRQDGELRALRERQAAEREAMLKTFVR